MPEVRRKRSDIFQLEEEIRRTWDGGVEAVAAVGRREQPAEADRSGSDLGQADAPGRIKKSSKGRSEKAVGKWFAGELPGIGAKGLLGRNAVPDGVSLHR